MLATLLSFVLIGSLIPAPAFAGSGVITPQAINISTATFSTIYEQTWTGSAVTPEPTVIDGATTLVKNVDYTLSYTNNVSLGTATVTATGIGGYSGAVSENFTITPFVYHVVTDGSGDYGNGTYITSIVSGTTSAVVPATLGGANVVSAFLVSCGIFSLDVSAATSLKCLYNVNPVSSLDVSNNAQLVFLVCSESRLTFLDVSANTQLTDLYCQRNSLTSLDVSHNTQLKRFACDNNALISLDVSANTQLINFQCGNNSLTSLDLSTNTQLTDLYCHGNSLISLDLSNNPLLVSLNCHGDSLTSLDLSHNIQLLSLYCSSNNLTSLDLSANVNLGNIYCSNNALTSLDLGTNTHLAGLYCDSNSLTSLDVSAHTNLRELVCSSNALTSLDVSANTQLKRLECDNNYITSLDASHNVQLISLLCRYNYIADTSALEAWLATSGHYGQVLPQSEVFTLSTINDQTWTGSSITPEPTVTHGGNTLTKDVDYTLSYTNNVTIGTATITVTGIGSYTGVVSKSFTITPFVYHVVSNGSGSYGNGAYITGIVGGVTDAIVLGPLGGASVVSVEFSGCGLTSLDVSTAWELMWGLKYLDCSNNNLTSLDVGSLMQLEVLYCQNNYIADTSALEAWLADGGHSGQVLPQNHFDISTATLSTIYEQTWTGSAVTPLPTVTYSGTPLAKDTDYTLSYTNNVDLGTATVTVTGIGSYTGAVSKNFTITPFFYYVITGGSGVSNGAYIDGIVGGVTDIIVPATLGGADVVSVNIVGYGITSLDVSANTQLVQLVCSSNQLTSLDVSANTLLDTLYCSSNQLTALNVSANTQLTQLDCSINQLTALDVSANTQLVQFVCFNNQLTALDVSANTQLTRLSCDSNQLTVLDVSANTQLAQFVCSINRLTSLDVSANTQLAQFVCFNNQLTALDVSANTQLTQLVCFNNQLTSLDVSASAQLIQLVCSINQLTSLDVSANTLLDTLYCGNNQLTALDISANTLLDTLYCNDNYIVDTSALEAWLTVPGHEGQVLPQYAWDISLATLSPVYEQTWTGSAITPLPTVTYAGNTLVKDTDYTLSYTNNVNLGTATVTATGIGSYTGSVSKDFTITPFVYHVVTDGSGSFGNGAYITGMTGGITDMVVPVTLGGANVVSVELSGYSLTALDVSAALALKMLSCIANNLVTLDVSHNTALEDLYCSGNLFTSLDISHNSSLEEFICAGNQLTSIDVSNNVALTVLDCSFNNLASLDVSHNTPLETLYCAWNFLTSLDISSNTQLNSFACENNSLTSLDVSHTTQLVQLSCNNNVLISLDVSANTLLTTLYCDYNYIIHTAALENWLAVSGHVGAVTPQNTVDITGAGVVLNPRIYTYTGSGITPVPVLTYSNGADTVALIEGTDYTLAYSDNVNVGTATITITGTGNCTGTTSATFDIVAADIASASIALIADETWTGSAITPLSVITFNGATLVKDTDYTLSYADNIEVGRATVTVSGIGNFKSSTDVTFNIIFKDITLSTIGAVPNQTWTGNAITPSLTVTYETITLVRDSDYTISYIGNTGVGTATIVISGIGHYRGNTSTTFNIVARDIVSATVAPVSDQTWTGSAITPLPVATFNGMTLVKDTDYTLSYVNNINVGTATITLTGINNLSGSRDVTFDIVGKDIASTVVTPVSKKLYTGSPVEPLLTIQDGSYTLVKDIDYTLSYTNNTLNGTATATASGIGHYTNTTSINFSVVRFSDVSYDLWYITDGWLTYVVENDLMSGYAGTTDFGPFDFISRAQVATVLYRAACKDDPSLVSIYGSTTDPSHYATTTVFVDEAVGVYYTAAINWAQAAGIMTGYAPEYRVVAPDNMISREELCTMIARYVRVVDPTKGAQTGPVDYSNIRGMDEVFDWARANVQWCASWGIVGGLNRGGGIFDMCPRDPAWRASMAKMITVSIRDVIG